LDAWVIVSAAGSAAGGAAASAAVLRGWWSRRELRQQRAFRHAVQDIVNESVSDVITRQSEFERRQGAHLDRQDQDIAALRAEVRGRGRGARRD
jgi:hypothetical protein